MNKTTPIRFATIGREFTTTLNSRVNDYFRSNKLSRHANSEMIIKTFCMFLAYFGPYALIVTGVFSSAWTIIPAVILMSFGLAGIGLSVMHDANHGAYSRHPVINTIIGYSINLIGANAFTWKMQHNVLHHSFTNIHEEDEDISPRGILRLTPHTRWRWMHKYQFIYAWFLYGLLTIVWLFVNDYVRMVRYHRNGLAKKHKVDMRWEWVICILSKMVYVGYILVIPILFTSLVWWQVVLGVLLMHYVAGFILAIIFQPAHVIEGTEFPLPDQNNNLENSWVIHQLKTTTNFGNRSRWFSWYVGGLNFQIEHHLFPNICHVHYRKISRIVRETTEEFGLPYKSSRTFMGALGSHLRLLKSLGARPVAS